MKKTIVTIAFAISALFVNAQTFNGVEVNGQLNTAYQQFLAKGYKLYKVYDHAYSLTGSFLGTNIELFIYGTAKTNKFYKAVVYLPKHDSYYDLRKQYDNYVELLVGKYGKPDNQYDNFLSPYYAGDGYEMQAVEQDKTNISTFWLELSGANYYIEISKFKQVKIVYENDANGKIHSREVELLKQNIF
jgi:hypothetical protein